MTDDAPVYATSALVEALCRLAADAEPESLSVSLATSAPADLDAVEGTGTPLDAVPPDAPVFSDFYFPSAGRSITAVFGVDLATPTGQVRGRFLSHPDGVLAPRLEDDLAARVLVAVPPWRPHEVRAYDRRRRRPLVLVAADAPAESV